MEGGRDEGGRSKVFNAEETEGRRRGEGGGRVFNAEAQGRGGGALEPQRTHRGTKREGKTGFQ